MGRDFNWKPYLIATAIVALLSCVFSYKIAIGIVIGTLYFFLNNKLNEKKFPHFDGKTKVVGIVFLIIILQFIMIVALAMLSYYIGGLYSFFGAFAGMCIPHIYFIIVELKKIKK